MQNIERRKSGLDVVLFFFLFFFCKVMETSRLLPSPRLSAPDICISTRNLHVVLAWFRAKPNPNCHLYLAGRFPSPVSGCSIADVHTAAFAYQAAPFSSTYRVPSSCQTTCVCVCAARVWQRAEALLEVQKCGCFYWDFCKQNEKLSSNDDFTGKRFVSPVVQQRLCAFFPAASLWWSSFSVSVIVQRYHVYFRGRCMSLQDCELLSGIFKSTFI